MIRHPLALVLALPLLVTLGCPSDASGGPSAPAPSAEPARVSLLFTSAGWGEVEPCHCPNERLGGLARRAAVIADERAEGPALAVDAGDTVFALSTLPSGVAGEEARARGRAVLAALGQMGYDALAVGPKDLAAGLDWLVREAEAAGVPLLSVNLRTRDGAAPFEGHRIVEVAGRQVALVGLASPEAATAYERAGLQVVDPIEGLRAEVAALPASVDRVVVLGPVKPVVARRAAEVAGIDLLLTAGNGRLTRLPESLGDALVYEAGERGQHLLDLNLRLEGAGPLVDVARRRAQAQSSEAFASRVAHLEGLLASAEDAKRPQLERSLDTARRQLERVRSGLDRQTGGEVEARLVRLTLDLPRDPGVAALVDEVTGAAAGEAAPTGAATPADQATCATGTCGQPG